VGNSNVYSVIAVRIRGALDTAVENRLQELKKDVLAVLDQIEVDLKRSTTTIPAKESKDVHHINRLAGLKLQRKMWPLQRLLDSLLKDIESLETLQGLAPARAVQNAEPESEENSQPFLRGDMK
jgi:hypothetical protein